MLQLRYIDDNALLQGLQRDEDLAWKQLLTQYTYCENRIFKIIKKTEDAEDVFAETLHDFLKNIRKPNFQLRASLGTFLSGIGYNNVGEYIRKQKNRKIITDIDETAYSEFEDKNLVSVIKEDLDDRQLLVREMVEKDLTEKCYEVIKAYYYNDKSDEEAYQELGYNSKEVLKISRHNCMKKFIPFAKERLQKIFL